MDIVERIAALFAAHGEQPYEGSRREAISATAHALQCAQLAEWAQADAPLVAAALLHDVGHFLAAEAIARNDRLDDRHEDLAKVPGRETPPLGYYLGLLDGLRIRA
jgi:predicted HD phosphohydrolase